MALLQLVGEETIGEDRLEEYFDVLYRVVCVAERPPSKDEPSELVRTTYIVDWEQLVHLLEEYRVFNEDIVEVSPVRGEDVRRLKRSFPGGTIIARA